MKKLTMSEIAARIDAHLKRFENSKTINKKSGDGTFRFYKSGAGSSGRWVYVCYITYQGHINLSRDDAEKYLAWLDAGNVGKHYEVTKVSE